MSTSEPSRPPSRQRSFLRFLPLLLIIILAGLALAGLWSSPSQDLDHAIRFVGTVGIGMLTLFALSLWVLVLSGWRWWLRLAVPVLLIVPGPALLFFAARDVQFSGDMVPHFHFIWEPSHDDLLEVHRQEQVPTALTELGDLSGNDPTDFPEYRGRQRDGIVVGPPLLRDWSKPPAALWREPVGGGYAGIAVAGNLLVTMEQRRDTEAIVAYDTATGRERWTHTYPARFMEAMGGPGPRTTPTITNGHVYALGAQGKLTCLDAATGKVRWAVDIFDKPDQQNIQWGMSGSPLVHQNAVIVNPGVQGSASASAQALVAYDRDTGERLWGTGTTSAAYSSPMLAVLGGLRQILLLDRAGLAGYDAAGGKLLWQYPWETQQGINVAQPVVVEGDRVFISSGYGHGCAMLKIEKKEGQWSARPLWENRLMRCKFSSPVAYQGHLYGLDDGVLVCLDQEKGERKWRGARYGHGQVLLSGDLLLVLAESGELALVEAKPDAFHEVLKFQALNGDKTWNPPALAGGKAFVRNHLEMACYDLTHP
jgi:outer membrane protein assembly factor BamB